MNRKAVLADVVVVLLSLHSKEPLFHTLIYIYITYTSTHTQTHSPLRKRESEESQSYIGPMSRSLQIWVRTLGLTVAFFDIMDYGLKIYQK